ncbi:MAG TPA: hypothetical protein VNB94_11045 [Mycobacteriales bacterium]|nr:hypothetical protein [Mycobacteriales bacterium]
MNTEHSSTQHAPSGADGDAEKTVAPQGHGASSLDDQASVEAAARDAGEYAAAVDPRLDPVEAAPIPADDTEALADPDAGSSGS